MASIGYKCKECNGGFEGKMPSSPEEKVENKCPMCGSTDVEQSDQVTAYLQLLEDMACLHS